MIRLHALHAVAWTALRALPPLRAKWLVDRLGRALPTLSPEEARRAAVALEVAGTCLSRALTIAACVPGSEVVIAADPSRPRRRGSWSAHAWVEIDGVAVASKDEAARVIARLR